MKLSTLLLESVYVPPSPAALKKKISAQKRAERHKLTVGEGPPYRVVHIADSKREDLKPEKCAHCKALLLRKQVTIEDCEGQDFIIGASCAKKVGGVPLAKAVRGKKVNWDDEQEYVFKLIEKKKSKLKRMKWNQAPFETSYTNEWYNKNYNSPKANLYSWANILASRRMTLMKRDSDSLVSFLRYL